MQGVLNMAGSVDHNRTAGDEVLVLADILVPERNSFGAVRLAMAVAVLASYSYWLTSGDRAADPVAAFTGHSLGEHAVQVFFFLSGLLVTQSLLRSRDIADFASARALRIVPALLVCVLVTALAFGPALSALSPAAYYRDPALFAYIAKTSALMTGSAPLPGLFANLPVAGIVNSPLWTLKYEVLCYGALAVFAVAGLFDDRWRGTATAIIALAVGCMFLEAPKPADAYTQADTIRYLGLFFGVGVLACLLQERIEIVPALLLPLASVFIVAIGTCWAELATALFLGYATIVVGSLDFGWLRRATNSSDLSYGVYLYACPIQQAMLQLYPETPPLPLMLAALAVVMPLAGLSWSCLEKPALGLRRRGAAAEATPVDVSRALRARANAAPVITSRADRTSVAPTAPQTLPRRDWRYARRRIPTTRENRLVADVGRYAPSRRARIRTRHRPVYAHDMAPLRFRPHLV